MPFPTPGATEERDAFISRCMRAEAEGIPDNDQRAAACYDAWRKKHPSSNTARRLGTFRVAQDENISIRAASRHGRDYKVIPVVALVEGVFQAGNAAGPGLFLASEFAKRGGAEWNGRPVTFDHPRSSNEYVSAGASADIYDANVIGQVFGARVEDGKLKADLWVDPELVAANDRAVQGMQVLEGGGQLDVSHAAWYDAVPVHGHAFGRPYDEVLRNVQPDHIAILPEGVPGACTWEDGCGTPRVAVGIAATEPCCESCASGGTCEGDDRNVFIHITAPEGYVTSSTSSGPAVQEIPAADPAPVTVGNKESEMSDKTTAPAAPVTETKEVRVEVMPEPQSLAYDKAMALMEPVAAAAVSEALALAAVERTKLIEKITAADGSQWTEDELKSMSVGQLSKMAGLIKEPAPAPAPTAAQAPEMPPSYLGAIPAPVQASSTEDRATSPLPPRVWQ